MISVKNLPPPDNIYPIRRALLSVYDKTGIVDFAKRLHESGVTLISTGGTAKALKSAHLPVVPVEDVTGYPEILGGRVKTLHPAVHGGLLARRTDPTDAEDLERHGLHEIDLVVVNLYPFADATRSSETDDATAVENIDIGGPTMLRAAAKNFFHVTAVCRSDEYGHVLELLHTHGGIPLSERRRLATQVFAHTAAYDSAVASWLEQQEESATLRLHAPLANTLRYGENPHQSAQVYGTLDSLFERLHGKDLSFNNLLDTSAALFLIDEFADAPPTVAILKHTNPCGVASAATLSEAYDNAFATDRQSPFGGIVVVNRALDMATAERIDSVFTEIIIAPEYEEGVLPFLMQKKNRRLLRQKAAARTNSALDVRSIAGGLLVQARDTVLPEAELLRRSLKVVSKREPTRAEWLDLDFAWRVAKHVKSNAIVYAGGSRTLGIGAGQMSRIDSSEIAVAKSRKSELSLKGSVVASDAFFPFADGLLEAASHGATAAIQPGGSIRDEDVIAAADAHDIAMVFTGQRHFRH